MATRPVFPALGLQTNGLPSTAEGDIASPARGREMRANLLSKLRAPPLVHAWEFWHERQDRSGSGTKKTGDTAAAAVVAASAYEARLSSLAQVTDVREFWEMFNNFDTSALPMRDAVHLFKKGVKPVWEDSRNARGGSLSFRVPKEKAQLFWKEICMMAIGEKLQDAIKSERTQFVDDICGISYVVKWTGIVISIWTRDGDHEQGINRLRELVASELSGDLIPTRGFRDNDLWYKKHNEHKEFRGDGIKAPVPAPPAPEGNAEVKIAVEESS